MPVDSDSASPSLSLSLSFVSRLSLSGRMVTRWLRLTVSPSGEIRTRVSDGYVGSPPPEAARESSPSAGSRPESLAGPGSITDRGNLMGYTIPRG
jgi:hypothetical protein